jgi:hypothetical protein
MFSTLSAAIFTSHCSKATERRDVSHGSALRLYWRNQNTAQRSGSQCRREAVLDCRSEAVLYCRSLVKSWALAIGGQRHRSTVLRRLVGVYGFLRNGRQLARRCARERRNIHCWKMLPRSAVKTVTENISLCVTVICKVQSRAVC